MANAVRSKNNKKKKNKKINKKHQSILLFAVGAVIVAAIFVVIYFIIFYDNKEISQKTDYFGLSGESTAQAGALEETLDNNKICFKETAIEINVGEKITPEVLNGSIDKIKSWESSDSSVAMVNDTGEITGISSGLCGITACVEGTDKLLDLRVNVLQESSSEPTAGSGEHETVIEDGVTYIDGIMMASKTFSLPEDFDPGVSEEALNAFNEMQEAAAEEGLDIYISSSYRSYADQERIYNRYVEEDGKEAADTYSARPGHSDHQTGLTFDLNSIDDSFGLTAESDWVKVNAHKYGFIIRYPEGKEDITGYQYEPWHIRYLGIEKATEVYESGLCLEEFLGVDSVYKD